jgi:hypothetical protein
MHLPLLAVLLAAAPGPTPAFGETPPAGAPAPAATATAAAAPADKPLPFEGTDPEPERPRLRLLGVALHAGAPDGVVLSAVVRPVKWVRASAGLAHNVLGLGVQGAVTAIPFHWAVTPTLTFTAGKFFDSDVAKYASDLDLPAAFEPPLRDFSYSFYSAQVGLEFGSQNGFTFFLRGGLAWVRSGLDGIRNYRPDEASATTVDISNLDVSATVPTVNLGFAYYIW